MSLSPEAVGRMMLAMTSAGIEITSVLSTTFGSDLPVRNSTILVMLRLRGEKRQRPNELAAAAGMTSGGMSKVIDHLEEAGFVVRIDDPSDPDGRSVYVELTAQGERMLDDILEVVAQPVGTLMEEMAAEARRS
jgi:DNA-binding MarR family transcriptional regulator